MTAEARPQVRLIHETNPRKYFPAIFALARAGRVTIVGEHRYSVVKEWLRAGLRSRTPLRERSSNAWNDLLLRVQLRSVEGETVILGFAPWDWRLLIYARLIRRNRVIYHTSWQNWSRRHVPRTYGPVTAYLERVWISFLRSPEVRVVCVLPATALELRERFDIDSIVIPHGVPALFYEPRRVRTHAAKLRLLYVGELSRKKGVGKVLTLMRRLSDAPVSLTVVGDGPLRAEVQEATTSLPIDYEGHISDRQALADLMASHDVLVALSQREDGWEELFGIAIVEAGATGLAVISSDHAGPRAVWGEALADQLFSEDDLASVEAAIRAMAADRRLVAKRAADLASRIAQYHEDNVAEQWAKVLEAH